MVDKADTVYNIDISDLRQQLGTDLSSGLTEERAQSGLERFGPNELPSKPGPSNLAMFLGQFNDFLIYILFVALIISGVLLKEYIDAVAILVILVLNAVLGFVQEHRAEQAMSALRELAAPTASVVRNGQEKQIKARDLVPGDLIVIEPGVSVPADARLVETLNLLVNEAALTGESVPVYKTTDPAQGVNLSPGDIGNMVFMGTHINTGHAHAVVVATGGSTEMGKIAELLQAVGDQKTPLQLELARVGKRIGAICLIAATVVFVAGLLRSFPLAEMLLSSVSLAVAAVPEGLPAIVTIALALGLQRMAKEHAIIRKLHSVETLGATTVICSDKTGTLTKNEMGVQRTITSDLEEIDVSGEKDLSDVASIKALLIIAALCNDAREGEGGVMFGDPTETALVSLAAKGGIDTLSLRKSAARLAEISFDSGRKRMSTAHHALNGWEKIFATNDPFLAFTKGAPEVLLSLCSSMLINGQIVSLDHEQKGRLLKKSSDMAGQAFRTMAFAFRPLSKIPALEDMDSLETGLVFVGLAALSDPPRPEVSGALSLCRKAGISVYMVTGDHRDTAEAVGRQIGLLGAGEDVMTGDELEAIALADLADRIDNIRIFARVAPAHKVKIVDALKSRGHIVAMTGDGVNDAPAIKRADIGIAMGISGTDVTKEASDMVLADDNFATIVAAVREGRVIFDNIKKFVLFLLSCNVSEVLTMFVAMIAGLPLPLLPIQILWINLITDGLPAIALGVDPADPDVMSHPPRAANEGVLSAQRQSQIVWQGAAISAGALGAFLAGLKYSPELGHPQTMVFSAMVLSQLIHAFNFRSRTKTIWSRHSLFNKHLVLAVAASIGLHIFVVYTPFMQTIFKTVPLGLTEIAIIITAALVPIILIDIIKNALGVKSF